MTPAPKEAPAVADIAFPDIAVPDGGTKKLPLRTFLRLMYPEIPAEDGSAAATAAAPPEAPPAWTPGSSSLRLNRFEPALLVLDVRSPAEHVHGNIPGSTSFPMFDDAERAQVGICYKRKGKLAAIELGLTIIGERARARSLAHDHLSPRCALTRCVPHPHGRPQDGGVCSLRA